jgi:hypothetical protein
MADALATLRANGKCRARRRTLQRRLTRGNGSDYIARLAACGRHMAE